MRLDEEECVPILEAVLKGDLDQAKANVKGNTAAGGSGLRFLRSVKGLFSGESDMENIRDDLFRRATDAARKITDSQFLTQLGDDVERFAQYHDLLQPLADKAKERALAHLEDGITKTTSKLTPAVHKIKEQDFAERVNREQASRAGEEQCKLRADLIRQVNNLSAYSAHVQVISIIRSNEC